MAAPLQTPQQQAAAQMNAHAVRLLERRLYDGGMLGMQLRWRMLVATGIGIAWLISGISAWTRGILQSAVVAAGPFAWVLPIDSTGAVRLPGLPPLPAAFAALFLVIPLIGMGMLLLPHLKDFWTLTLIRRHATQQGRVRPQEVVKIAALPPNGPGGIPLAMVGTTPIGLPFGVDSGHGMVIAPTRSGKGLHATEVLLSYPGAVVIVDPKGEQYDRTAGTRIQRGPIYRIPEQDGVDLSQYFDWDRPLDVQELHNALVKPWQDKERIFADKSLWLFAAAAKMRQATGENPLRILIRWLDMPVKHALQEAAVYAPSEVSQFLDGDSPNDELNRFAGSAWGVLSTRLGPLKPMIHTITMPTIPTTWASENATIYICYPLDQLKTAGGMVAAILSGFVKGHMRLPAKRHALLLIDEMPTVALDPLDTYLATVGGYGLTIVSYIQSMPQLEEVYNEQRARSLLANCHHQLFYPPRDLRSAEYMSDMFGTELTVETSESRNAGGGNSQSQQLREQPAMSETLALALPEGYVLVFSTLGGRQQRILAQRMNPIPKLAQLPKAPAIRAFPVPRVILPAAAPVAARPATASAAAPVAAPPAGARPVRTVVAPPPAPPAPPPVTIPPTPPVAAAPAPAADTLDPPPRHRRIPTERPPT